jgi:hypothetical protein
VSPEDKAALRRRMRDRAWRAANVHETTRAAWIAGVRREAPEVAAILGERELTAIAELAWSER